MCSLALALLLASADATAILKKAQVAVLGEQAAYTLEMVVTREGKAPRKVEMKGFKKGDDLGLVRYIAPPKERGTAYLRNGDSNWLYLPNAGKVVRVGPKQSFAGGDFSNGDIFRLSLTRDYEAKLEGEEPMDGAPAFRLELKAKDRSVAYDRIVYWVRSDGTYFPVRSEYYTLSGKLLKVLALSEVRSLGGHPRPTRLSMENRVEEGSRTEIRFLSIEDGVALDERLFAPAGLERGE